MRSRALALSSLAVGLALLVGACGGSSKSGTPASGGSGITGSTVHVAKEASDVPSESAKMVCETEAINDINAVIGLKTVKPMNPTWVDHVYSCDYVYPGGATMKLSVKEVSSPDETTAYFDGLATKLGKKTELQGLGQGAFITKNGDTVVRKDFKILTVDVSKLPAQFGDPPDTRANDGENVAATIMGCWTGA